MNASSHSRGATRSLTCASVLFACVQVVTSFSCGVQYGALLRALPKCNLDQTSNGVAPLLGTVNPASRTSSRRNLQGALKLASTASGPVPVTAPPNSPHIVILPGFGNAQQDYLDPFGAGEEVSISYVLRNRGFDVHVMPLQRTQWLNVLRGIFSINFWLSKSTPYEPGYGWYVDMARASIAEAAAEGNGVVVVGHSAGGWLGRAVIGDGEWMVDSVDAPIKDVVKGFVSLGAPHKPPSFSDEVMDMTRGALSWTDAAFPGAHLSDKGIPYVTVASDLIPGSGDQDLPRGDPSKSAYESYRLVCGLGDVEGDGVVPLVSAHLDGAEQVTLQCYHSITPPSDPFEVRKRWYGSDLLVDAWLGPLMQAFELGPQTTEA